MNKRIWNLYAPLYERAMRGDRKVYQFMYDRIPRVIRGKEVLELATGPGLLAKHVAHAAKRMVATDYAEGMIHEAQKGPCPANLTFEVADATALPYPDASFDVVLIANALHIMPDPEQALREIRRVLRPGGLLIAPNFVEHNQGIVSVLWSGILKLAGISFAHQWSAGEYLAFLRKNGWEVLYQKIMPVTPESMAVMIEDAILGNLNEAFFCRLRAAFIFYGIRSRSTARRMPTCTAG